MEKRFVTVHLKQGQFTMELIQFVIDKDGTVLAICMDEVGDFDTYGLDSVKGDGFKER